MIRFLLVGWLMISPALAHDKHYAVDAATKQWFDGLSSKKGPCCSNADGTALPDVDWETDHGHYRVNIENVWIDVPDEAIVTVPNLYGRAMVWPVRFPGGIGIRCFMPGPGT